MYLNDLKAIFTSIRSFSLYIYLTDKTVSVVTLFTLAQMIATLTLYSVNLFYSLRYKYIFRKCNCNKANANTCCWLKLRRQSGGCLATAFLLHISDRQWMFTGWCFYSTGNLLFVQYSVNCFNNFSSAPDKHKWMQRCREKNKRNHKCVQNFCMF